MPDPPLGLSIDQFALEITNGLKHLHEYPCVKGLKGNRFHVWANDSPLPCPVITNTFSPTNVAAFHAVCPNDIFGEMRQHAIDCPGVEPLIQLSKHFLIMIHHRQLTLFP